MANILYITYDGILDPVGQSQVLPYLRGLAKRGAGIFLLSFEKKWRTARVSIGAYNDALLEEGVHWDPLTYHKSPVVPATLFDILSGVLKAWFLTKTNNIRIVHARGYISGMIVCVLKVLTGVKFIFDMRGFWPEEKVDAGAWRENGSVYNIVKQIEKQMLRYADEVIVLTNAAKDVIGERARSINVIPCCVDLRKFSPGLGKPRDLPAADGRLIISYVGSAGTFYNFTDSAKFFLFIKEKYPDAYFLVLTNSNRDEISGIIAELNIKTGDYSIFSVASEDVPSYLGQSSLSLIFYRRFLSKTGCCPIKFVESLACAVPVVVNQGIGDCDRMVKEDGIGITLRGYSQDAYKEAVDKISNLMTKRDDIAKNCRRVAGRDFSLDSGVDKYLSIYEKLDQD